MRAARLTQAFPRVREAAYLKAAFPHAASWRTDCAIEGHYVTMTLDWNVDLPSVAGQLTAAVRDLCPELEHKPFHLFVKRKDENGDGLGWEYCGRYERVPDCLPMELNPNPDGDSTSKTTATAATMTMMAGRRTIVVMPLTW